MFGFDGPVSARASHCCRYRIAVLAKAVLGVVKGCAGLVDTTEAHLNYPLPRLFPQGVGAQSWCTLMELGAGAC